MTDRPRLILHTDAPEPARAIVHARHPEIELATCDSYEGLPGLLEAFRPEIVYTVRFAGTPNFPRDALLSCPNLKWIAVGGSGTDHLGGWDRQRITVTNSAGVAADMMAQYAVGAMFAFTLGFPAFAADQRRGHWGPGRVEPIDGKTVLILGLGKTGQAVAARAKALDLTVLGVRANPAPTADVDEVYRPSALPELWSRADFIVVSLPLLANTRGLVDEAAFAAMRPGAVLIDVSRGGVVREAALLAALTQGDLKGAALDVFETEPLPADHPLWRLDNVILTPHCSSVYPGWEDKSVDMFCDNLDRYLRGQPLANIVLPERGY